MNRYIRCVFFFYFVLFFVFGLLQNILCAYLLLIKHEVILCVYFIYRMIGDVSKA